MRILRYYIRPFLLNQQQKKTCDSFQLSIIVKEEKNHLKWINMEKSKFQKIKLTNDNDLLISFSGIWLKDFCFLKIHSQRLKCLNFVSLFREQIMNFWTKSKWNLTKLNFFFHILFFLALFHPSFPSNQKEKWLVVVFYLKIDDYHSLNDGDLMKKKKEIA